MPLVHLLCLLSFRSAARYTKFRNQCYSDQVRQARLAPRGSSDDPRCYFQPTLWVQCFVSSFYLLIFLTLLPAVRPRIQYLFYNSILFMFLNNDSKINWNVGWAVGFIKRKMKKENENSSVFWRILNIVAWNHKYFYLKNF